MQWRDATVNETDATGFEASGTLAARQEPDVRQVFDQVGMVEVAGSATALPGGLDLPCTEDPELFFAESPEDVETAKAMCRGCEARLACLTGALERREPWGVWGGELLMRGAIVPRKRPRGRPRKTEVAALSRPNPARWPDSTGHAAKSGRAADKEPRGRVPHTMHSHTTEWSTMRTEMLARERMRTNLQEAEQLRFSRRMRVLRRASRLESRAERRMVDAWRRAAELRGALETADY